MGKSSGRDRRRRRSDDSESESPSDSDSDRRRGSSSRRSRRDSDGDRKKKSTKSESESHSDSDSDSDRRHRSSSRRPRRDSDGDRKKKSSRSITEEEITQYMTKKAQSKVSYSFLHPYFISSSFDFIYWTIFDYFRQWKSQKSWKPVRCRAIPTIRIRLVTPISTRSKFLPISLRFFVSRG